MLLGARTAAWAKSGGWVNPYVTDGLVAMWDAEWNAGPGVHDNNATVWKDLVGTNDLVSNNGNASWSSKFWEGDLSEYFSTNSTEAFAEMICNSDATIEFASNGFNGEALQQGIFEFFTTDSQRWSPVLGMTMNNSGNNVVYNFFSRGMSPSSGYRLNGTYCIVQSGLKAFLRRGGSDEEYMSFTIPGRFEFTSTRLRIGYCERTSYARIGCLRVYNRALSYQEYKHNFDVDNLRFFET